VLCVWAEKEGVGRFVGEVGADGIVRLSERLSIPVATSAPIQIPSILAVLPTSKSIGVITFDSSRLGALHLTQLGISAVGRIISLERRRTDT
jgi:hypothetical protein